MPAGLAPLRPLPSIQQSFFSTQLGGNLTLMLILSLQSAHLSVSRLSLLTGERKERRGSLKCHIPSRLLSIFTGPFIPVCPNHLDTSEPVAETDSLDSLQSCCGLVASSWDHVCVCVPQRPASGCSKHSASSHTTVSLPRLFPFSTLRGIAAVRRLSSIPFVRSDEN